MSLTTEIAAFVQDVADAMGAELTVEVEETPDATRINLTGDNGGLLTRRSGEGLQALQHVVATAFRRQLGQEHRVVVDCNGYRREKDAELRQMARYFVEKARSTGMPQEMGPLNPYERRVVHMAVAEEPEASSESVGDAFEKTLVITAN